MDNKESYDTNCEVTIYVYIIAGLLIGGLTGALLLGVWLTGFRKPVVVKALYEKARDS